MYSEYDTQEVIMDTKEQVLDNIDKKLQEYWHSLHMGISNSDLSKLSQDEREDLLDYFLGNGRFASEDLSTLTYLSSKQRMKKQAERNNTRSSTNYVHTPEFLSLRDILVNQRMSIIKNELYESDLSYADKREIANKLEVEY